MPSATPDPHGPVDSRSLPMFAAGAVDVPFVIKGMDELVSRDTVWEAHAHPTHELLWNQRGASSATTGTRIWTITPTLGLWVLDVLAPSPHELFVQLPRGDLLRPIADALTENPADPRSLADWAGHLGVSPRTVTRAFRAETGLSFARWQAVLRAQRAVLLLARGASVEHTAESVGYRSASAFGVAFRRTTGRTPGQFRPV